MHNKSISELVAGLTSKQFSSVELTQHYLDRISQHDNALNSFVTTTAQSALAQAAKADERIAQGNAPALTGIPIAHKDIFCTMGVKTSVGSKMLDNFISPYDATVVEKFNAHNTVMLGKTNMDEFAMGSSNETNYHGKVSNPWDIATVPGGSSGGSAAAVAARLAPGATGTDTGGSIRQPAAFCGITGLKPTYGRVSRYGIVAFASSLDQAGPMAPSAEDCAYLLQAMAGFDEKDSTSTPEAVPDYVAELQRPIQDLTIGIPKEFFPENLHSDIAKLTEQAIKEFEKLGAKIVPISLKHTELSIPVYYVIAPAECSSNLARYDGVRFGHRTEGAKNLEEFYKNSRSEGFGSEVKRRILIGTYVLSSGYYDAYYLKAQKVRRLIAEDYQNAFKQVDLILGPTTPEPTFKFGEKSKNPVSMYLSDLFTSGANLAGLPGISIPAGFTNNLPVGVQLLGNYFQEARLLQAAHQYQLATDWHTRIPAAFA